MPSDFMVWALSVDISQLEHYDTIVNYLRSKRDETLVFALNQAIINKNFRLSTLLRQNINYALEFQLACQEKLYHAAFFIYEHIVDDELHSKKRQKSWFRSNTPDLTKIEALIIAIEADFSELVEEILIIPNVNVCASHGHKTPLLAACKTGHLGLVERLINIGGVASINACYKWNTPVNIAAQHGHLEIVSYLYDLQMAQEEMDMLVLPSMTLKPWIIAAQYGQQNIIQWFLDSGYCHINEIYYDSRMVREADKVHTTLLMKAAQHGQLETVRWLYERYNANVNVIGLNPHLIEEAWVDEDFINQNGRTALFFACSGFHVEVVDYLLQKGANPNLALPPIFAVIKKDSPTSALEIIASLVAFDANLNAVHLRGYTPLMWSYEQDSIEVAQELISLGANINANTAFFIMYESIMRAQKQWINLLIEKDIDPNILSDAGKSVLEYACREKKSMGASLLVCAGADVALLKTPFHSMVKSSFSRLSYNMRSEIRDINEMFLFLINHGLDPNTLDEGGNTPLMLAETVEEQHPDFTEAVGRLMRNY